MLNCILQFFFIIITKCTSISF